MISGIYRAEERLAVGNPVGLDRYKPCSSSSLPLLELLDDRIGTRSTLITSQLPVKAWHTYLGDPTLADAILDRVVHSSHKIELKGTRSMRDNDGAPEQ